MRVALRKRPGYDPASRTATICESDPELARVPVFAAARMTPRYRRAGPFSLRRESLIWAALFVAFGYLLHLLGGVITPFAAGIALGYLLDPVVLRLERLGLNRLRASLVILIAFSLVFVLALIIVVPILSGQLVGFAAELPNYAMRLHALAVSEGNRLIAKYGHGWVSALGLNEDQLQQPIGAFMAQGAQWLVNALRKLVSDGAAVFDFLSLLIITPVVAFYILVDWERMIATIDSWLPLAHRDELRGLATEINRALAGFIRGQSLVCLFLGLWYGGGLSLIGLDFGFLIGAMGGVLGFIPYVGSMTVLVLSVVVSLVQGWPSLTLFFMTLVVVGIGQFLEGYVVSPRLVGGSVGLHPVWLMFALFAFGKLFGFVGLMIAVPTAAAIGVVVRHLLVLYRESALYLGPAGVPVLPPEEP